MRLTCPSCGAVASLEAWANDEKIRWCLKLISEMPAPVAANVPQYLGLFRDPSSTRGLGWPRVKRLLAELKHLVEAPEIKWKHKAPRPGSPRAWGLAMERLIQNPPSRLPLTSHGYLRAIAYEIADELDVRAERQDELTRSYPYHRVSHGEEEDAAPRTIPSEIKAALEKIKEKAKLHGAQNG